MAEPAPKLKFTNRPRSCDRCGKTYGRRNLIEAWHEQNAGHRDGWQKTRMRICTRCGPAAYAQRVMMVAYRIK